MIAPAPPEGLHLRRERHVRCNPALAQYIVDEGFAPVRCEGFFDKEALDAEYMWRRRRRG